MNAMICLPYCCNIVSTLFPNVSAIPPLTLQTERVDYGVLWTLVVMQNLLNGSSTLSMKILRKYFRSSVVIFPRFFNMKSLIIFFNLYISFSVCCLRFHSHRNKTESQ